MYNLCFPLLCPMKMLAAWFNEIAVWYYNSLLTQTPGLLDNCPFCCMFWWLERHLNSLFGGLSSNLQYKTQSDALSECQDTTTPFTWKWKVLLLNHTSIKSQWKVYRYLLPEVGLCLWLVQQIVCSERVGSTYSCASPHVVRYSTGNSSAVSQEPPWLIKGSCRIFLPRFHKSEESISWRFWIKSLYSRKYCFYQKGHYILWKELRIRPWETWITLLSP